MEEIKQPENFEDDNIWCEGTTEVAEQQINQSFEATHLNGPEPSDEGPLGSMDDDDDDDDSFRNPFNDDIFSENDNVEPQNEIGEPTPLPQSYSDSGSQVESRIPELNDNVGQDNKKNMPAATSAGLHSQQNEVNYGVPGTHQQNPVHLTSQIPPLNGFNTSYQHKPSAQATLEAVEPLFSAQRNTQQIEQVHSNNLDSANQGQSLNALSDSDVPSASEIIELLEEEDEPKPIQQAQQFSGIKRARPEVTSNGQQIAPASASYNARYNQMPDWMKQKPSRQGGVLITPGSSLPGYQRMLNSQAPAMQNSALAFPRKVQHQPYYVTLPPSFVPTWRILLPQSEIRRQGRKSYELSLLNVKEFTITGLPIVMDGPPSSITGLRKKIKEISRDYGTAIFEREGDGGLGRWKIPLVG